MHRVRNFQFWERLHLLDWRFIFGFHKGYRRKSDQVAWKAGYVCWGIGGCLWVFPSMLFHFCSLRRAHIYFFMHILYILNGQSLHFYTGIANGPFNTILPWSDWGYLLGLYLLHGGHWWNWMHEVGPFLVTEIWHPELNSMKGCINTIHHPELKSTMRVGFSSSHWIQTSVAMDTSGLVLHHWGWI